MCKNVLTDFIDDSVKLKNHVSKIVWKKFANEQINFVTKGEIEKQWKKEKKKSHKQVLS